MRQELLQCAGRLHEGRERVRRSDLHSTRPEFRRTEHAGSVQLQRDVVPHRLSLRSEERGLRSIGEPADGRHRRRRSASCPNALPRRPERLQRRWRFVPTTPHHRKRRHTNELNSPTRAQRSRLCNQPHPPRFSAATEHRPFSWSHLARFAWLRARLARFRTALPSRRAARPCVVLQGPEESVAPWG